MSVEVLHETGPFCILDICAPIDDEAEFGGRVTGEVGEELGVLSHWDLGGLGQRVRFVRSCRVRE